MKGNKRKKMVDTGDIFMVEWIPGDATEGKYLMMVVEPHHSKSGWICEMCHTGKRYVYYIHHIEEGKKLLEQQTS